MGASDTLQRKKQSLLPRLGSKFTNNNTIQHNTKHKMV
jgi:hypothetical protein